MANDGDSKLFPLAFYDGECELKIGHVSINSSLDYKAFQQILSQKIGISPNQMSIYLVDRKKSKLYHQDQRKVLITGRASFRLILKEKDCAVLVVLKRSRRDRRRRSKLGNVESSYCIDPENFILLRRNMPEFVVNQPSILPYFDQLGFGNLGMRAEEYVPIVPEPNLYDFPVISEPVYVSEICNGVYDYCEECMNARRQGNVVPFHLCVNDPVTASFRSPAGPIARPNSCY
ncbi:hypothetical protein ACET3Z_023408 [Daucus carota]